MFPLRPRPRRWVHFGHLRLYGKDGLSKFHTTDETGPRPHIRGFSSTFRLFAARRSCGQAPADRTRAFTLLSEVHFFHLDSEFGLNITTELPPSSEMQELGEDASDCATSGERCPDSSPIPSTPLDSFLRAVRRPLVSRRWRRTQTNTWDALAGAASGSGSGTGACEPWCVRLQVHMSFSDDPAEDALCAPTPPQATPNLRGLPWFRGRVIFSSPPRASSASHPVGE